jgi:2-polyprenyl-3-methyl-5-hydroxy-6-metoxy-1,4-benzoquinol methylase
MRSNCRKVFDKEGVYFDRCRDCGTVFVNPAPPSSLLESLYEHYGKAYFTQPAKLAIDFSPDHYRREVQMMPTWICKGRMLDVGCSTGSFLRIAATLGFTEVRGIDISENSVQQANAMCGEGAAIAADFLSQPFEQGMFDSVTMWATLEHVSEPKKFIEEAYRILKPHGTVLVSVPNRSSINFKILGRKWDMVSLEHLNYYSKSSLSLLLSSCGFHILEAKTAAFNPIRFLRDLRRSSNAQPTTSEQIKVSQVSSRLRKAAVVAYASVFLDHVLCATGCGDLLLVVAAK